MEINFKNINFSKHSLVRYFTRVKFILLTDLNYDRWKKEHEDDVKEAQKEIIDLLKESTFIKKGSYQTHKTVEYYVHFDKMLTFIIDNNTLITVYDIDYNLDNIGNKDMLNLFWKNLNRIKDEFESVILRNEEEKNDMNYDLKRISLSLIELDSKMQFLRESKKELEQRLESIKAEEKYYQDSIDSIAEKIVISRKYI